MNKIRLATIGLVGVLSLAGAGCQQDDRIVKPCLYEPDKGWIREGEWQYRRNTTDWRGLDVELNRLEDAINLQYWRTCPPEDPDGFVNGILKKELKRKQ